MLSIDDLDVAGRRVLLRSDLNVPLDKAGSGEITDDGRIRASLPVIRKLSERGARVVVMAHLGRPKGADFAERAAAPSLRAVAERLGELLGPPVAFAADLVGPSAAADGRRAGRRRTSRCWRTCASSPRKRPRTMPNAPRWLRELAELRRRVRGRRVRRGAPQAGIGLRPAALLPHAAGDLVAAEVAVLERLTESPGAALRGRARRLQGVGQARRDRQPARPGRPPADRRRHGLHVPRRPGLRGRQLAAGGRPDRAVGPAGRGGGAASRSCCRSTSWRRPTSRPTPGTTVVAADAIPADRMGLDIGPDIGALFAAKLADAQDRVLERPDGRVRVPGVRRRHPGGRRGADQGRRAAPWSAAATRRRRCGRWDSRDAFGHISTGGGASLEYLEGKTLPGLAALTIDEQPRDADAPAPADRRQLEDELNHLEAIALVQKLAFDAAAEGLRRGRGGRCCRRSPTCAACRRWSTATSCKIGYGAQDLSPHDSGAYTGEISGPMLAKLGCTYVLCGHSERRQYHGEDDALVNAKVRAALAARHHADPVRRRGARGPQGGRARRALPRPARRGAGRRCPPSAVATMVIAYEPVWAIGTGEVATPEDAQEMCARHPRAASASCHGAEAGRGSADPVRRLGQGRQRGADHGPAGRRRRPRRRREPGCRTSSRRSAGTVSWPQLARRPLERPVQASAGLPQHRAHKY